MEDRREFLKKSVLVATGLVVGSAGKALADGGAHASPPSGPTCPAALSYRRSL